jgi:hypothetical protein
LAVRFDRKANLEDIHLINEQKANDAELKEAQSAIGSLNDRIKQIAII